MRRNGLLVELSITNFAIIESLRLEFSPGFSVMTGETGAGKSIIIDAVGLLLGGRASTDLIRTGCERASIEGVFSLSACDHLQSQLNPLLVELGLIEDLVTQDRAAADEVILHREISTTLRGDERSRKVARSICRVNGRAVTLSALQDIGRHFVDIHGQGKHLSLLRTRHHVDFLDQYGGLLAQRQAFGALVRKLGQVRREREALQQDERELARRVDLLSYQIDEIRAAALQPGEEADLRHERSMLANAEKRMQLSAEAHLFLSEGQDSQRSVTDLLGSVLEQVSALTELDEALSEVKQRIEEGLYELEDLARTIRDYRDAIEHDPDHLETVEERLNLIHSLKRKYGDSIPRVLDFAGQAQSELDSIVHSEERIEALGAEEETLLDEIAVLGAELSAARKEAAERLGCAVEAELAELNMERAHFLIDIHWVEDAKGVKVEDRHYGFDATGLDRVEFLIAPNPGEEPKPLARSASGGETSRLMLAMKTALSAIDPVPTLIFDEIDAGIGGRTGQVVGRKLRSLAKDHQVFCVTHLAQIASQGDQHFHVSKDIARGRTTSMVRSLSHEERIEELALMLGGRTTEATLRSAKELLGARPKSIL